MTTRTAVPTTDSILAAALNRFYELRPRSFDHINFRTGRYWQPFLGYRAQIALNILRLAGLVRDSFATTAKGAALVEWVASECAESPDVNETTAVGSVTIGRGPGSTLAGGDIPKGSRITRAASTISSVTVQAAVYETLADAHFDLGQTTPVTIPIAASRAGEQSNHPILVPAPALDFSLPTLFDRKLTVTAFDAAGGSDKMQDPVIRRFARAVTPGLYGPTRDASVLGALRTPGVQHCIVYDDPGTGTNTILVADESWASSSRLSAQVEQGMRDAGLIGFGCRVAAVGVRNQIVSVDATVRLRTPGLLVDPTEIAEAIRVASRAYFDDRADWNVWKFSSLKGAIVRSHQGVLNCTAVSVKTANGEELREISAVDFSKEQFHYLLASNAMRLTFLGPT